MAKKGDRVKYAVLMHVYNEEKTIRKVLNRINAQTVPPELVFIIVDGSTDKTKEIVKASGHPYAVRYATEPAGYNRRRMAFNAGLNQIHKRFDGAGLLKVDGDTLISVDYAEKMLNRLNDPGVGAVSGISSKFRKTRNLNNGAVMYRLGVLPCAPRVYGWDMRIENKIIALGYRCVIDASAVYIDLRLPSVEAPRLTRVIKNRVRRKIAEIHYYFKQRDPGV